MQSNLDVSGVGVPLLETSLYVVCFTLPTQAVGTDALSHLVPTCGQPHGVRGELTQVVARWCLCTRVYTPNSLLASAKMRSRASMSTSVS